MSDNNLVEEILRAGEQGFSGRIEVYHQGNLRGQIVFVDGKIAWSVSDAQVETLGSLLWRLGYVTKGQLEVVRNIFSEHQGRKKLGAILEECGFASREVLRRGLCLHTRSAVRSLIDLGQVTTTETTGRYVQGDQEVLFPVSEIVLASAAGDSSEPEDPNEVDGQEHYRRTSWKFWYQRGEENEILSSLMTLPHYVASGIYTSDGSIVTAHVEGGRGDPLLLGIFLASTMDSASRSCGANHMGSIHSLQVNYTQGWMVARWLDSAHDYIISVLVEHLGDPVQVMRQIDQQLPELEKWLDHQSNPDRFRTLIENLLNEATTDSQVGAAVKIAIRERLRQMRARNLAPESAEPYQRALALVEDGNVQQAVQILDELDQDQSG